MHAHLNKFNRSACFLTSVKLSISGQEMGSQSLRSPKPLLYCRGGDSVGGAVLCVALAVFAADVSLVGGGAYIRPIHSIVQRFASSRSVGDPFNIRAVFSRHRSAHPLLDHLICDGPLWGAQFLGKCFQGREHSHGML
jgi:hypothetical protein